MHLNVGSVEHLGDDLVEPSVVVVPAEREKRGARGAARRRMWRKPRDQSKSHWGFRSVW